MDGRFVDWWFVDWWFVDWWFVDWWFASSVVLYRNDGTGKFSDVTTQTGLLSSFYGMGVAAGDYDNDGDVDLFVTSVNSDHLFRNDGGVFSDVTGITGVGGGARQWGTSCGFLDFDNDGDLDLFVCNYVRWFREVDFEVNYQLTGLGRAYGPPTASKAPICTSSATTATACSPT